MFRILHVALTALSAVAMIGTPSAQGQQYTLLHTFTGSPADGSNDGTGAAIGRLTSDSTGRIYGATTYGGAAGFGTVFELDTSGETVLHNFTGGVDGAYPNGDLVRDSAGNLYGTTQAGGYTGGTCHAFGCGVIFKLDPTGTETVLYSFMGGTDGEIPTSGLIWGAAGNLYGTGGGGPHFGGTVYKLGPAGKLTVIYGFTGGADGSEPYGGVIRDAAGNLYGTTLFGGVSNSAPCSPECGVIFKIDPIGKETVLHSFTGSPDGCWPTSGVIQDSAGNLYGTTSSCGTPFDTGTAFKVDASGTYSVLHIFHSTDGASPEAGLVLDAAGNLYGNTWSGGTANSGVVFKMDPSGGVTVLYSFPGGKDGGFPSTGLRRYPAGGLYGFTNRGGDTTTACPEGCGVVFRLTP